MFEKGLTIKQNAEVTMNKLTSVTRNLQAYTFTLLKTSENQI